MNRRRALPLLALVAVLALSWPGPVADAGKAPRILQHESVVQIEAKRSDGRTAGGHGVVVAAGVLTCAHVVENATAVSVVGHDGKRVRARAWRPTAQGLDAALLTLESAPPWPALRVARTLPTGTVYAHSIGAWGRAMGEGRSQTSWGYVFGRYSFNAAGHTEWLGTSIALVPGMSGSPLIYRGEVIGLASIASFYVKDERLQWRETSLFACVVAEPAVAPKSAAPRVPVALPRPAPSTLPRLPALPATPGG